MPIPFLDLARLHRSVQPEIDDAIASVIAESAFIGGAHVARFERSFVEASGLDDGASCGSGTDALTLALLALGVGRGDEVIVPAMTFVATAEAVVHAGATPVLADVNPTTLLLDELHVEAVRTARTRAVIPVHLYGHVVPLDALDRWRTAGLRVVEDVAQAHLATWHGRRVGTAGDAACFSFYPGKNLGALGDGGFVAGSADLVASVRSLRDHGAAAKYEHDIVGFCSRLDGLQAAVLEVKLRHLQAWTDARRSRAERYRARLDDLLVPWEQGAVHHLLVIRVPDGRRDDVQRDLAARGVATGIHYPRALSQQPALAKWSAPCPNAERAAAEVVSLPMDPLLGDDEVDAVCDAVLEVV